MVEIRKCRTCHFSPLAVGVIVQGAVKTFYSLHLRQQRMAGAAKEPAAS